MADLAEVKRRADAVIREQDAIDFIDWCRDLAPVPTDAPGPGLREALRTAHAIVTTMALGGTSPSVIEVRIVHDIIDALEAALAVSPAPSRPEGLTAEAFHDAWVGRGMRCDGTHAVGEALCQNVTAVLARLSDTTTEASDG